MNSNLPIPIVVAFTPNYFVPAATCLFSILKSSKCDDIFDVFILLSEELAQDMRDKLENLEPTRMNFHYLNLEGLLSDIYVDHKYTIAASYRLILPNLLPNHQKIIYTDCDLIFRNNLAELYRTTKFNEASYLAAVYEAPLQHQIAYIESIGCIPGKYFNSGVLLMNLQKMREDNLADKLVEAANNPDLQFPDQDALNQLCKNRILPLDPIYNSIRTYFLPQYRSDFLQIYSEKQWKNVQSHGNIHYTGDKPWRSQTIMFKEWWKTYNMLPKTIQNSFLKTNTAYIKYLLFHKYLVVSSIVECIISFYRYFKYRINKIHHQKS